MFGGFGYILVRPGTWIWAFIPTLILFALFGLFGWVAFGWLKPALEGWIGASDTWYGKAGTEALGWVAALLAMVLGVLLSLAIAPPLSAPALEKLVEKKEDELGIPRREPISLLSEIWCGVRAQLLAAMFLLPLLLVLWIIDLIFPPASVVTTPLKFLLTSLGLAWNLYDYPLTLRGVRIRERLGLLLSAKRMTLGFGLAFALLFWIPCFNVLMLPVGVIAATELTWRLLRSDDDLLPEVARHVGAPHSDASLAHGDPQLPPQLEVTLADHEREKVLR